jgi:hypothetical protein
MPVISGTWEVEVGESWQREKYKTLSEKHTKSKRTGVVAQVVKISELNPQYLKKKKKKRKKEKKKDEDA